MKNLSWEKLYTYFLNGVRNFVAFFLLMDSMISFCIVLFLHAMQASGVTYTQEDIAFPARITFVAVMLLSLLCSVLDSVRRYLTISKPVKEIMDTTSRVVQGDFSARIDKSKIAAPTTGLPMVADNLNQMIEELAGIETLRTDFIANVSHELKSPLTIMQNYGTLLQQPKLSDEKRLEYAKSITDASRSLASMVTNILKLNKLENQTIYTDAKVYDLSEQFCECFLSFQNLWEKKGLDIHTDIEEDVLVKADPELLSLVWNNLFSNAIKFTEPGGRITLRLKKAGAFAIAEVADTGCGISPEEGKHIFEKFYQGDTSHATRGNGLGLALVKRVIDIADGNISVKSEVGKGSTFTVKLKRSQGEPEAARK